MRNCDFALNLKHLKDKSKPSSQVTTQEVEGPPSMPKLAMHNWCPGKHNLTEVDEECDTIEVIIMFITGDMPVKLDSAY